MIFGHQLATFCGYLLLTGIVASGQSSGTAEATVAKVGRDLSGILSRFDQSKYSWMIWTYKPVSFQTCNIVWEEIEDTHLNDPPGASEGMDYHSVTTKRISLSLDDVTDVVSGPAYSDRPGREAASVMVWVKGKQVSIRSHSEKTSEWHDGKRSQESKDHEGVQPFGEIKIGSKDDAYARDNLKDAADLGRLFKAAADSCGAKNVDFRTK